MDGPALYTEYAGRRWPLFWLAVNSGLFTILTLGFYRFWMKTRLRRYYWSAIRPGSAPLEYVGEPLEKLLGFLTAVVFLAFYIGVVNLILMFVSFTWFQNNLVAYGLSFVGVLPVIFFAQYRARRYILARTRWRGVRFAMEPGAWGYAWRAALYWIMTICTAGILWPLKAYRLEKYRTDRTLFGDARLYQGGRWTMLARAMRPLYVAMGLTGAITALVVWGNSPALAWAYTIPLMLGAYGVAHWQAHSFRLLMHTKELGGVGFRTDPRPWRIFWIYSLGYPLAVLGVLAVLFGGGLGLGLLGSTIPGFDPNALLTGDFSGPWGWLYGLFAAVLYFSVFLMWSSFTHVFITLPVARHFAEATAMTNAHYLAGIRQRPRDEFAEAEGFADALDVGAAL
jgi:hypothetical protein